MSNARYSVSYVLMDTAPEVVCVKLRCAVTEAIYGPTKRFGTEHHPDAFSEDRRKAEFVKALRAAVQEWLDRSPGAQHWLEIMVPQHKKPDTAEFTVMALADLFGAGSGVFIAEHREQMRLLLALHGIASLEVEVMRGSDLTGYLRPSTRLGAKDRT